MMAPKAAWPLLALLFVLGCANATKQSAADRPAEVGAARPAHHKVERDPDGFAQVGLASWYGSAFAGKQTANGERFDPAAMTAAHRELPFGTWVEVRRVDSGRSVRVRVNDRGPFGDPRRVIDLSRSAAEALGMIDEGAVEVQVRAVSR